jgi:hypothetical protein
MKIPAFLALLLLITASCEQPEEATDPLPDSTVTVQRPPLQVPGTITGPDSAGIPQDIEFSGKDALLVYYWIPMIDYEESEHDLRFLAGLPKDCSILVLPVQFDPASRNHAQMLVNELGVSLTVYLGNETLREHLSPTLLPLTVLIQPGNEHRETGFGGPERLLVETGIGY